MANKAQKFSWHDEALLKGLSNCWDIDYDSNFSGDQLEYKYDGDQYAIKGEVDPDKGCWRVKSDKCGVETVLAQGPITKKTDVATFLFLFARNITSIGEAFGESGEFEVGTAIKACHEEMGRVTRGEIPGKSGKKYTMDPDDTIKVNGHVLHRIIAARCWLDSSGYLYAINEYGGYIESEDNLSHDGACWVNDCARVYGNARVRGNAGIGGTVCGNAVVEGDAEVWFTATVRGNARVSGNAHVGNEDTTSEIVVEGDTEIGGDFSLWEGKHVFRTGKFFDNSWEKSGKKGKKNLMEKYTDDALLSSLNDRVKYEVKEHDWGFCIDFRVGYVWADVMVSREGEVTYGNAIDMPKYASNSDVNAVMEQGKVKEGVSPEKFLRGFTDSLVSLNDAVTAHYKLLGKFSQDLGGED